VLQEEMLQKQEEQFQRHEQQRLANEKVRCESYLGTLPTVCAGLRRTCGPAPYLRACAVLTGLRRTCGPREQPRDGSPYEDMTPVRVP
jgi:hypothetical protein